MQPIEKFTAAEIPRDLYFVRRPERAQGRVTIPTDLVGLIGSKIGDVIVASARNPECNLSVTFTSVLTLGDGTFTMPKAVREAIGVYPGSDGEYQNVEIHLKTLYRAPDGYQVAGRPRTQVTGDEDQDPKTYQGA